MTDLILDTDIGWDSDDLLALLYLLGRNDVNIRAILCTPGRRSQLKLLSAVLYFCGRTDIKIGFPEPENLKDKHVNSFHMSFVARTVDSGYPLLKVDSSAELLQSILTSCPDITYIAIGPLTNLRLLMASFPAIIINRLYAMGGYFNRNTDMPLPNKFAGKEFCEEYNFSADRKAARVVLQSENIKNKYLVSKNITHLAMLPKSILQNLSLEASEKTNRAVYLLARLLESYRDKNKSKKIHDPLTVCAALNKNIVRYEEVRVLENDRRYGAESCPGTRTFISVWFDRERFLEILLHNFL